MTILCSQKAVYQHQLEKSSFLSNKLPSSYWTRKQIFLNLANNIFITEIEKLKTTIKDKEMFQNFDIESYPQLLYKYEIQF